MTAILEFENSGMVLRIPITAPAAASSSAKDGVDMVEMNECFISN